MQKIINYYRQNKWFKIAIGALGGALAGLLYWNFVGCNNGHCPLTNNPYKTVIVFTVVGGFLAIDNKKKQA